MLRAAVIVIGVGLAGLGLGGCGGGDDGQGLEALAGFYDVSEAFVQDVGNQCPPEPTEIFENLLEVRIDRNQFEARFRDRWDVLLGEIHEDTHFLSSGNLGPDQALRFSGDFVAEALSGMLDDVRGAGCTRTFSVNGTRRPSD